MHPWESNANREQVIANHWVVPQILVQVHALQPPPTVPLRTNSVRLLLIAIGMTTNTAAPQGSSAAAWRDLTLADVDAAYGIIARNHPAAVALAALSGPYG